MATGHRWQVLDQGDRLALARLGLLEQQVVELDKIAENMRAGIPFGRAPTITEMKAPLKDVAKHIGAALAILVPMLEASNGDRETEAFRDAMNWLYATAAGAFDDASSDTASSADIRSTIEKMATLKGWCDQATSNMPVQARSRTANHTPIGLIWQVVRSPGDWTAFHKQTGTKQVKDEDGIQQEVPVYAKNPIGLSSDVGSPFREICRICYQAASGNTEADPERAIKSFIIHRKRVTSRIRHTEPSSQGQQV